MTQTSPAVKFDVADGIASITLNRPDAGNAIDFEMVRGLLDAAIRCQADAAIRCVVLTGTGRLFCAGGDIALFREAGDQIGPRLSELAGLLHMAVSRLARMEKPLLVLVNGPAAGAGLSLALAGDMVLAARSAHFTTAYGTIALTPDGGMSWLLPRLVGLRRAQELILTNRRVLSDEAERIGLVTRVVDDERLTEEGAAMAATLAGAATRAIGAARALLRESFQAGLETQLESEAVSISRAGASPECGEGIAAFFDKRPPDFTKR